jgi:hypothetical protein
MIWIMIRVLRVRENLQYQLAYLSSELREIFENVPRTEAYGDGEAADKAGAGNRKPIEGEDCPICFTELGGEPTVFCKTACGNNFHSQCLKTWAATKKQAGAKVTCPLCRSPWDDAGGVIPVEDLKAAVEQGEVGDEGYVNVAGELGISQDRGTCLACYFLHAHIARLFDIPLFLGETAAPPGHVPVLVGKQANMAVDGSETVFT